MNALTNRLFTLPATQPAFLVEPASYGTVDPIEDSEIPLLTPGTQSIDISRTPYSAASVFFVDPKAIVGWEHKNTTYNLLCTASRGLYLRSAVPPVVLEMVDGKYRLLDGHHRLNAALYTNLSLIPATFGREFLGRWRNHGIKLNEVKLKPFVPYPEIKRGHFVVGWERLPEARNMSPAQILALSITPEYFPTYYFDRIDVGFDVFFQMDDDSSVRSTHRRYFMQLSKPIRANNWDRIFSEGSFQDEISFLTIEGYDTLRMPLKNSCDISIDYFLDGCSLAYVESKVLFYRAKK